MITQFALLLAHGISLMWMLMPRRLVTSGFFRIQSMVAMGLCVLAALAAGQLATNESPGNIVSLRIAAILAAVCGYFGSVFWRLDLRKAGTWCLSGVFVSTLTAVLLLIMPSNLQVSFATAISFLSAESAAAVVGGATAGMLLGHWYLTAPMMSLEPLKRLIQIWLIALMVRFVISGVATWNSLDQMQSSLLWTWMSLRWLAGLLAPLLLAVMSSRILNYRNTQAATGVLFAGVILVFLGEMSAALLQAEIQRPM